jgi:hypothetical protein
MPYVPYRRACLLRPFNDVMHLFVVMNDPCPNSLCLCVMISSVKKNRNYDSACLLQKGDHDFITGQSYVVYRLAEQESSHHIANMVAKKYYVLKADMSEAVFAKIVAGLHASDETRPRIITYANNVGIT